MGHRPGSQGWVTGQGVRDGSQARESGMGHRQFHAGEEGQGGNLGNKQRATASPIGPYFQLNSPNNFSVNQSVDDSNHCT